MEDKIASTVDEPEDYKDILVELRDLQRRKQKNIGELSSASKRRLRTLLISYFSVISSYVFMTQAIPPDSVLNKRIYFLPKEISLFLGIFTLLIAAFTMYRFLTFDRKAGKEIDEINERTYSLLENATLQRPENTNLAWVVARRKLEIYHEENLSQIKNIYNLSHAIMVVGIIMIISAIIFLFCYPYLSAVVIVTAISGSLTEFVGVICLGFYKTALKQSTNFINSFDKTGAVGVALQVLENISTSDQSLSEEVIRAKIKVAKSMMDLYHP